MKYFLKGKLNMKFLKNYLILTSLLAIFSSAQGFAYQNDLTIFRFGILDGVAHPARQSGRDAKLVFNALNLRSETQYVRDLTKTLGAGDEKLMCVESFNVFCLLTVHESNLEEAANGTLILRGDLANALYENLNDNILTRDGAKTVANISCKRVYHNQAECILSNLN